MRIYIKTSNSLSYVPVYHSLVRQGNMSQSSHYAFLMVHPKIGMKIDSYIGYSTNPFNDVHLHNTLAVEDTHRTGSVAPHWTLDMVLGPFTSSELAIECTQKWPIDTKGPVSKRHKGKLLKDVYDVKLVELTS